MNFVTLLGAFFAQVGLDIYARLQGVFSTLIGTLENDEAQILHDAIDQYTKDRAAGKDFGTAAADALNVFFNEEKGEVSKAASLFFQAFLAKQS